MFPSVPVFKLKALHQVLMKNEAYASRAQVTQGYRQLLDELSSEKNLGVNLGT